jgi:hypothetical protein
VTSWRTLATVPRFGLATLVQVAAALAVAAATTSASAIGIASWTRCRRLGDGPVRSNIMLLLPRRSETGCAACGDREAAPLFNRASRRLIASTRGVAVIRPTSTRTRRSAGSRGPESIHRAANSAHRCWLSTYHSGLSRHRHFRPSRQPNRSCGPTVIAGRPCRGCPPEVLEWPAGGRHRLIANELDWQVSGKRRLPAIGCAQAKPGTRPGLLVCCGAPRRNRTGDPILTMDVLCRLS